MSRRRRRVPLGGAGIRVGVEGGPWGGRVVEHDETMLLSVCPEWLPAESGPEPPMHVYRLDRGRAALVYAGVQS